MSGWLPHPPSGSVMTPQLVLTFGSPSALKEPGLLEEVTNAFPDALLFGCSTAGEIHGTRVTDLSLVVTCVEFESSSIETARVAIENSTQSYEAGQQLAASISAEGLRHAFVLSDGLSVNGSDFVSGLRSRLPANVTVTGGLSGDGPHFKRTYVIWNGIPETGIAGIVGFYGDRLSVGYGSLGGWDPFGPERIITRSSGNVLYEFDGRSALALYKTYLGEHAAGLPATGLLFPLSLRTADGENGVVRTILAIDEETQSMTFAGDVPEGSYARLMKANFDRLIDGAVGAAKASRLASPGEPDLAVLISCVGRKLLLGQRIEEEVEGVREVLGDRTVLTGFYSYGEISPFTPNARCELHNQTMTITTITEGQGG
ncbi:MAG: FIST N-terminal domain-containing protein [Acidobacteriota bacterium]